MSKKIEERYDNFKFTRENSTIIENILKKYPTNQSGSAVMPLLDLAMRQCNGWIPEAAMKEVSKIKEFGVTEEELCRAKNKMRSGFYHASESSYSSAYRAIRERIFGDKSFSDLEREMGSVTISDISEAARLTFDESRMITMICEAE